MASDEQEVKAAAMRFYDAIDHMARGEGLEPMKKVWHHADYVTSSHPVGNWAHGWDEVLATWEVFSGIIGNPNNSGAQVKDLRVFVLGDIAYTTCVYVAPPAMGAMSMNCTNILQRVGGEWKIIHHHPDKAPEFGEAMEKLIGEP